MGFKISLSSREFPAASSGRRIATQRASGTLRRRGVGRCWDQESAVRSVSPRAATGAGGIGGALASVALDATLLRRLLAYPVATYVIRGRVLGYSAAVWPNCAADNAPNPAAAMFQPLLSG